MIPANLELTVLAASVAAALVWAYPVARRRLALSMAKHPSLTGHVRWAKRITSWIPGYAYDERDFFASDGAPADVVARRMAGFRSGEALAAHYASSDMFLFPSLTETYGNVTPEAMASGLPVVDFDDAAAGQLIYHGVSGLLATRTDDGMFVRLATELAGDATQRSSPGERARARALELGWDSIIRSIERIYGEAVTQVNGRLGTLVGTPGW